MEYFKRTISRVFILARLFFIPYKHTMFIVYFNGIGLPMVSMLFLILLTKGDQQFKIMIIAGSIIAGNVMPILGTLANKVKNLAYGEAPEFFLAERVSRLEFLLGVLTSHLFIFFPASLAVFLLAAILVLPVPLTLLFVLKFLMLFVLSLFSISWIGILIGFKSKTFAVSDRYSSLMQFILIMVCPAYYSPEQLPVFLKIPAHLLPTTAMNRTLVSMFGGQVQSEYLILAPFILLAWGLIGCIVIRKFTKWSLG